MKSMKFASLILLCATSSLALILPALGVVSFPQQLIRESDLQPTSMTTGPEPIPPGSWQPAQGSAPAPFGAQGIAGQGGLPIATNFPPASAPSPPSLDPSGFAQPTHQAGSIPGEETNKIGTGLWLLLGPIWIASLIMWTIAPGPKANKK
jgi:hypothetical protein